MENTVRALVTSEGKFFSRSGNDLIGLNEEITEIVWNKEFVGRMIDTISYRRDRYYEERKI